LQVYALDAKNIHKDKGDNVTEWRSPPTIRDWQSLLEPLKDRPNVWAVVAKYETQNGAASCASKLRHGTYRIPAGRYQYRSSKDEVFARYLGEANKK